MSEQKRVEWSELRGTGCEKPELFFLIAEENSGNWEFFERSTWELRWYQIPSTAELVARTAQELRKCHVTSPQHPLTAGRSRIASRDGKRRAAKAARRQPTFANAAALVRPASPSRVDRMVCASASQLRRARNQLLAPTVALIVSLVLVPIEASEGAAVQQARSEESADGPD